ncbi:hypothetical protein GUJ93_ZPchr0001g32612 [Zizania palustris]|uniref:Uncharacterized protein n=1 Tax=Zizania palustris TaxID=103762 RepID=A0A8J5SA05_ZIZPA|nr:hypothetical protein GUJ93_ZPchr0001g32612 [Zizania palustris]
MFKWNNDQQQVGDAIWADFNESQDHIVPYPKETEDSALVSVGDQKKNDEETTSIPGLTEQSSDDQTEFPVLKKQSASQASGHYSATRLDMESWSDLPSLNATLDRNYSDDNIASTYLDFSSAPNLQKVTGNTTVQLDGETEVFGNDHEEQNNSFLDCDWGNIGDFDDFDRLFSNGDSIFGNEMVADGSNFLSTSSDLVDSTVQSVPFPVHVSLNKQLSSDHGSSLLLINESPGGTSEKENKVADANAKSGEQAEHKNLLSSEYSGKQNQFSKEGDVQKKPVRSRRRTEERASSDSSIFAAESRQSKPVTTNYRLSIDSPKQSSSTEKSQDMPSKPLMMTPQEKIEKLRRRQQMQALIAIQQQQQQFGKDGSSSDIMRKKYIISFKMFLGSWIPELDGVFETVYFV